MENESWNMVEQDIQSIGEYYDSAASIISFGMMNRWRRRAAAETADDMNVLEVGSGPGSFSRLLHGKQIVLLEPNEVMLRKSLRTRLDTERYMAVIGVAEHLPFVDGIFDRVMSGFSFKNFMDKEKSLVEMHRVLGGNGRAVIIDIAEPDSSIRRRIMHVYMRHILGRLAMLSIPREVRRKWKRNPWQHLSEAYMNLGRPEDLTTSMRALGYRDSSYRYLFTHGVAIVMGDK